MPDPVPGAFSVAALLCLCAVPAAAGLRICNEADVSASVAIGYSDAGTWTSEGWWNVAPGECSTVIARDLPNRFYYWRADSAAGVLRDGDYYFCTAQQAFTITGDTGCEQRGFDREGFSEVDVGDARDYAITLTSDTPPPADTSPPEETAPDIAGADIGRLLAGTWEGTEDPSLRLVIADDIIEEFFFTSKVATWRWTRAGDCGGGGGGGVVLRLRDIYDGAEKCWHVEGLDRSNFVVRRDETDRIMPMRRIE